MTTVKSSLIEQIIDKNPETSKTMSTEHEFLLIEEDHNGVTDLRFENSLYFILNRTSGNLYINERFKG